MRIIYSDPQNIESTNSCQKFITIERKENGPHRWLRNKIVYFMGCFTVI